MEYNPGYRARVDFWMEILDELEQARPREWVSGKPPLLAHELSGKSGGGGKEEL